MSVTRHTQYVCAVAKYYSAMAKILMSRIHLTYVGNVWDREGKVDMSKTGYAIDDV